jgi:hypothetical protein
MNRCGTQATSKPMRLVLHNALCRVARMAMDNFDLDHMDLHCNSLSACSASNGRAVKPSRLHLHNLDEVCRLVCTALCEIDSHIDWTASTIWINVVLSPWCPRRSAIVAFRQRVLRKCVARGVARWHVLFGLRSCAPQSSCRHFNAAGGYILSHFN